MPTTQSRTLENDRVAVGLLLGAVRLHTTTSEVDASSVVSTRVRGAHHNGYWVQTTSGTTDGERQQVSADDGAGDLTTDAFTATIASGVTFELWEEWARPEDVEAAINQAIIDATGAIFTPTEDITLHTGGKWRFDIPTTFEYLKAVLLRTRMVGKKVVEGAQVWSESVDADFTITQDDEDRLFGQVSTKFVTAGTISNGDFASIAIASNDLSEQTHIEFGIKVATAVASDDLRLRLSATANGASTTEEIIIPAILARTETWVRVAMTAPELSTAIVSVALEYNANAGANTIWLTGIDATQNDSYTWDPVERHLWEIDKEARDLIFKPAVRQSLGYWLIKLVGGDNPLILTADADVSEVPDTYIINQAAGYMAQRPEAPTGVAERASGYFRLAADAKKGFPMLVNARFVT